LEEFSPLTDGEIAALEAVVKEGLEMKSLVVE